MIVEKEGSVKVQQGYMPQLDVLRAIAVALVIIQHWFYAFKIFRFLPEGELGVKLFFVLSGYLITRILLDYKQRVLTGNMSMVQSLKKFYYRRFLRIFPIYYLLLFLLYLIYPSKISDSFVWHFFYLSNYFFYFINHGWGYVSHFWSLSVEEQFYIFWPFVILLSKRKYLLGIIIGTTLLGILFRATNFSHSYMYYILTPACFDALGLGALLALKYDWITTKIKTMSVTYFVTLLLSIGLIIYFHTLGKIVFNQIFLGLFIAIFSFLAVAKLSIGSKFHFIFENRILIFIGKISYGIYLYHNLIPFTYINHVHILFSYLLRIAVLLLVASASYYIIERPFLKFKDLRYV